MVGPVDSLQTSSLSSGIPDNQSDGGITIQNDQKINVSFRNALLQKGFSDAFQPAWKLIHSVWLGRVLQLQCGQLAHSIALAAICDFVKTSPFKEKGELLDFLHSLAHGVYKSEDIKNRVNEFTSSLKQINLESNLLWKDALRVSETPSGNLSSSLLASEPKVLNVDQSQLYSAIQEVQELATRLTFKELVQEINLTPEQFCASLNCACGLKHPESVVKPSESSVISPAGSTSAITDRSSGLSVSMQTPTSEAVVPLSTVPVQVPISTNTVPSKSPPLSPPTAEPFDDCGCGFDHNTGLPIGERLQPIQPSLKSEFVCADGSCSNPLHQHSPSGVKPANRFGLVLPAMGLLGVALTYLVYDKFINVQRSPHNEPIQVAKRKIAFQAPKPIAV